MVEWKKICFLVGMIVFIFLICCFTIEGYQAYILITDTGSNISNPLAMDLALVNHVAINIIISGMLVYSLIDSVRCYIND